MSLQLADLHDKDPGETVPYSLDLSRINTFADDSESITSVAWATYLDSDDPAAYTDLPAMRVDDSFSGDVVSCRVSGGTAGLSYILRAYVTCISGSVYKVAGRFKVKYLG